MSNRHYSNKGVNSAAQAEAKAAAEQAGRRQTIIICVVAVVLILAAIILAITLGDREADDPTTTIQTDPPTTTNVDMTAIQAEIDSLSVADFKETDQTTEYVKLTIQHHGDVILRLRPDIAPITVANFQKLVSEGFYDGLSFHRVVKGFMIQGGEPKGADPANIKGEFAINGVQNDLSHVPGVISMARLNYPYDSASSQFFICNADASPSLDGKYAGFGYVVAGLDVILTVSEVEVEANSITGEMSSPVEPLLMEKVCFVTRP